MAEKRKALQSAAAITQLGAVNLDHIRMYNMDVEMIFKIAAIGIIVAILNQLLVRSGREEQALLMTIAGLVVALMMIISQISDLFTTVKNTFGL